MKLVKIQLKNLEVYTKAEIEALSETLALNDPNNSVYAEALGKKIAYIRLYNFVEANTVSSGEEGYVILDCFKLNEAAGEQIRKSQNALSKGERQNLDTPERNSRQSYTYGTARACNDLVGEINRNGVSVEPEALGIQVCRSCACWTMDVAGGSEEVREEYLLEAKRELEAGKIVLGACMYKNAGKPMFDYEQCSLKAEFHMERDILNGRKTEDWSIPRG